MLSKKNRISQKDFPAHTRQGFRVHSPLFSGTIYSKETDSASLIANEKKVRVSVVVSKKTAKNAVDRNYLRRITYEAMEPYLPRLTKRTLIVLYPKKETQIASFVDLKAEIEKALISAKCIL